MRRPDKVCIHEAAHAVIAHCLAQRVDSLTWNGRRGRRGTGFTWFTAKAAGKVIPIRRIDPVVFTCILMAGYVAEVEWSGWDPMVAPWTDWEMMKKRGITWRGRNTVKPILRTWIRAEKAAIFAVARALEAKRKLSRRQFLDVLKTVRKRK